MAILTETYHSPLPNNTHAVLHPRNTVRDFSEVIFAHGLLFSGEGSVVRCHDVQSVTASQWKGFYMTVQISLNETIHADQQSLNESTQYTVNPLTFPEGWAGNWVCWGRVWVVAQWRKQLRGPSPGGSTASRLRQHEQWSSLHAPLSLLTNHVSVFGFTLCHLLVKILVSYIKVTVYWPWVTLPGWLLPCILADAKTSPADMLDTFTRYMGQWA